MKLTAAKKRIAQIDKNVDSIRKQLRSAEKINPMSAESWQAAWDKHPDLRVAETKLFAERGKLQLITGAHEAKVEAKEAATARRKEVIAARHTSGVFQYLYDCKASAKRLGLGDLGEYYSGGLSTYLNARRVSQ